MSFYDSEDNETINHNKEIFLKYKKTLKINQETILYNSLIKEFNKHTNIKFLKASKNTYLSNTDLNKEIFISNNLNYNILSFLFEDYHAESKEWERKIQFIQENIDSLPKENINDELNNLKKKSLQRKEKAKFLNQLIEATETVKHLDDYDFLVNYNQIILEIKKIKFTELTYSMDDLFKAGANSNSIHNLLLFLKNKNIIPDFLLKEFYLYEVLFRHQFSHGWHFFFSMLLQENNIININWKTDDLSNILSKVTASSSEGDLNNLRANLKKQSLHKHLKIFYRFNLGVENNLDSPVSCIYMKEKLIHDKELIFKFKKEIEINYLQNIKDFQNINNINVFCNEKLDHEINLRILTCDRYNKLKEINMYYNEIIQHASHDINMSLNTLIYYIYVFLAFYIKKNK